MTERKVTISTSAPASPNTGDGWIHTTTRIEKIWDGSNWVIVAVDAHKADASAHHAKTTLFTDLTDTPAAYTGETGKFPKVNVGEDALEFAAVDGGGTDLFDTARVTISTPINEDTGAISQGGTGSVVGGAYAILKTMLTTGSWALLSLYPMMLDFTKNQKSRFIIFRLECPAGCTIKIFTGQHALNANHFGYRVEGSTVYAVTGDGTNETTTDVSAYVALDTYFLKTLDAVLTPGVDCKFYIDGVLRATHEANLPSGVAGDPFMCRVENGETTSNCQAYVSGFVFQRDM